VSNVPCPSGWIRLFQMVPRSLLSAMFVAPLMLT